MINVICACIGDLDHFLPQWRQHSMEEIVKILLSKFERRDMERVDRFGKTALHYAAALGHRTNLVALVSANPSLVYVADNDGNLPLHIIVKDGHQFQMVKDILSSNACVAEILDRKGRNALHVAVMNGNLPMLKFLLELPEFKVLINEPDSDGNTPLHLAVKIQFLRMVMVLQINGASGRITNKQGLTPVDVNENGFRFKQNPIKITLIFGGAVHSPLAWVKMMAHGRRRFLFLLSPDLMSSDLRSLANTISVVAALIATITFASAFTFPGGYKNNDPGEGLPVFIRRTALKAFVLSDTVAFCSSLTVAFFMVYTLVGEPAFLVSAMRVGIALLWVAVSGTAVAFASALYVVLSDQSWWLAIAVLCVGCSVPLLVFGAVNFSWFYTPSRFKKLRDKM
ncbi:protein ACCELERATED CELL DEATH 6-like protein isoform X2 [Cinnamomum micranthum f. kanehirae]|uniref:Protein ACCELERATED CELL DEATH 6-like protein isoform X2 n=1 Tax=Cinnamomum micranthum f. kanehirae TaxID=337451 RepID=A0A443P2G9_9MAGN|nr:protein ACCELERATED CELL DEATH 6-like protein isoform X2 [Cinnamomum micranthum f. kanehirae]